MLPDYVKFRKGNSNDLAFILLVKLFSINEFHEVWKISTKNYIYFVKGYLHKHNPKLSESSTTSGRFSPDLEERANFNLSFWSNSGLHTHQLLELQLSSTGKLAGLRKATQPKNGSEYFL